MTTENIRTLNFTGVNSIETLTLDELKQTYLEHNISGNPMHNGIYHYDLIERIGDICTNHGLDFVIADIFAAQNKRKGYEGVAVAPHLEEKYGKNALQAHALRRVFTTIKINTLEDDDSNTGLAIAYHQNGIQIAIGPNVKICTNQCILSKERIVQTYGANKVSDLNKVMEIVDDWMHNFNAHRAHDVNVLNKMKTIQTNYRDVMELIGNLTSIRVSKDSKHGSLRGKIKLDTYPLTQAQITEFTEGYLLKCLMQESDVMSLYDVYNIATELHKPGITDMSNIIPQNAAWTELITEHFELVEA